MPEHRTVVSIRRGDSDVWLYTLDDKWHCGLCCEIAVNAEQSDFITADTAVMARHLEDHRCAGQLVPDAAFAALGQPREE